MFDKIEREYLEIIESSSRMNKNHVLVKEDMSSKTLEDVSDFDFQGSFMNNAIFNGNITSCNFINTGLGGARFNCTLSGFSIFSGANLKNASFEGKCDHTVIFLGCNIDPDNKPSGGIQSLEDLIEFLDDNTFSEDEIKTLHDLLIYAYKQVKDMYDTINISTNNEYEYHINESHIDCMYGAINLLKESMNLDNDFSCKL